MSKGISAIIATIMLLMITVSLIGVFYVFSSTTVTQTTSSGGEQVSQLTTSLLGLMRIDNVNWNKVDITNIGSSDLSGFVLYLDDQTANYTIDKQILKPKETATISTKLIKIFDPKFRMFDKLRIVANAPPSEVLFSDHGKKISYYDYDSFDQPYPGGNDDWWLRNGVDPDVTASTFNSPPNSLHMPSGWGGNFEGGTGLESGQTSSGYDTNTYPYMCMAYKIPAGTINNMLILVNGVWRSITMTQGETPCSYPKAASWNPLTTDNQWNFKCINLDEQLDASLGSGVHTINAVIWHDGGCLSGITGEFWIDDFIIFG